MAAPEADIGLIKQLLEWAWAGVLALGAFIFKGVKEDVSKKASQESMNTIEKQMENRRNIEAKLFDKIDEEADKTTVQISQVSAQINKSHIELLNAIHAKK